MATHKDPITGGAVEVSGRIGGQAKSLLSDDEVRVAQI